MSQSADSESPRPIRAFIAIPIPRGATDLVREYQDAWRRVWPDRAVSWTRTQAFHLTLRFLGETTQDAAADIGSILTTIGRFPCFSIALLGPIAFPGGRHPRVLGFEAHAAPVLADIVREIEGMLERQDVKPRDWPFRAHVTLGRVRHRGSNPPAPPAITARIEFDATQVVLYSSSLLPEGSQYEALTTVHLGRPPHLDNTHP